MTVIDVRQIPPPMKHPTILSTFMALKSGETMTIVNDHDPKPLYYQFSAEFPGTFEWKYVESGPQVWQVTITRL